MSKDVMYLSDGDGKWWRREWAPQCSERAYFNGKCQGIDGHKGVHWCFGLDGSFQWSDNDDFPSEDGCSGSTPPGHKLYRTPESMQRHYHLRHHKTRRVTDKKIVAKLEKDKTPERGAIINRPVRS